MAGNTGRTTKRYTRLVVNDSTDTLREIPIDSINGVKLDFAVTDVSAWQDAIKNVLADQPAAPIEIGGPFDNSAAAPAAAAGATPTLSGSHTILSGIVGDNKPHTLGIACGIREYYSAGEPVFYLQRLSASNSGYTCLSYEVDPGTAKYKAKFDVMGGIAPAWYIALPTAGA